MTQKTFKQETKELLKQSGAILLKEDAFDNPEAAFMGAKAIALLISIADALDKELDGNISLRNNYGRGLADAYQGIHHAIQQGWKQSDVVIKNFYKDVVLDDVLGV